MIQNDLREAINDYEKLYYRILQHQMQIFARYMDIFPEHMKGYKTLDVHIANDGVLVWHKPGKDKLYIAYHHNSTSIEDTANHLLGIRYTRNEDRIDSIIPQISVVKTYRHQNGETHNVVNRVPWDLLEIIPDTGLDRWKQELAISRASQVVLSFVTNKLLHQKNDDVSSRKTRNAVVDTLECTVKRFRELLNTNPDEASVHKFLKDNIALLSFSAEEVSSKISLGNEHVTDFVIQSRDCEYILVEIEAPTHKLFTRNGNPTAALTHAIRQTSDWRDWIAENTDYARRSMPGITEPKCWVVIGRSTNLNDNEIKALRRMNKEYANIQIKTYDDLIGEILRYIANMKNV